MQILLCRYARITASTWRDSGQVKHTLLTFRPAVVCRPLIKSARCHSRGAHVRGPTRRTGSGEREFHAPSPLHPSHAPARCCTCCSHAHRHASHELHSARDMTNMMFTTREQQNDILKNKLYWRMKQAGSSFGTQSIRIVKSAQQ